MVCKQLPKISFFSTRVDNANEMLDIVHNNLDYDEELSVARLKVSPGPGGKGLEVRPVLEQV